MARNKGTCPMCGQVMELDDDTVTLPSGKIVHKSCAGQ
jgi:hypothetical protein